MEAKATLTLPPWLFYIGMLAMFCSALELVSTIIAIKESHNQYDLIDFMMYPFADISLMGATLTLMKMRSITINLITKQRIPYNDGINNLAETIHNSIPLQTLHYMKLLYINYKNHKKNLTQPKGGRF